MASGNYYQGYGTQIPNHGPIYPNLNASYGNQSMPYPQQVYGHQTSQPPVSVEYLRQPASAPYASAPYSSEPVARSEPQVIVVHQRQDESSVCEECCNVCCRCICSICGLVFGIFFAVLVIALVAFFVSRVKH